MSLKLLQREEAKQVVCSHAALSGNVLINNPGPDRCCQLHHELPESPTCHHANHYESCRDWPCNQPHGLTKTQGRVGILREAPLRGQSL